MTPAERAVIDLALEYHADHPDHLSGTRLGSALNALERERAAGEPRVSERTWAEVVEGDEIYSARTGRWYEVIESRRQTEERMAIMAKGLPKILKPKAADPVRLKRGASGDAADVLVSVLISGPATMARDLPEEPAAVDVATDPEASEE